VAQKILEKLIQSKICIFTRLYNWHEGSLRGCLHVQFCLQIAVRFCERFSAQGS
jgi:AMMECR1 domain-containing protein